MYRLLQTLALLLACQLVLAESDRVALVIGNADYEIGALSNPLNDARAIAHALEEAKFDVILLENASRLEMEHAVDRFSRNLHLHPKSVAFFYYSGHGAQYDYINYLLPIDNKGIKNEQLIRERSMSVNYVLDVMKDSGSRLNIVILDACRNAPFRGFRGLKQGLASIKEPRGTIISYSTAVDELAEDGEAGGNSPYTQSLLKWMRTAQPIESVFSNVANDVDVATNGRQMPWFSFGAIGKFCFVPSPSGQCGYEMAAVAAAQGEDKPATITQSEKPASSAQQNAIWVDRLIAWADEFNIVADTLPREQEALLHLEKLELQNKKITRLPAEIAELRNLRILDLKKNALTALPPEIGELQQLQRFSIADNKLTSLPVEIGKLGKLQELGLARNQLEKLPASIGKLKNLQVLGLGGNRFTTLPKEILALNKLQSLWLYNNRLTSLPADIGKLKQLQVLDIRNNDLQKLPEEISQLTKLDTLKTEGNARLKMEEIKNNAEESFVDVNVSPVAEEDIWVRNLIAWADEFKISKKDFPRKKESLLNLRELELDHYDYGHYKKIPKITYLPPEIGKLSQLQSINLFGNNITTLPIEIGQLQQLRKLDLSGNNLTFLPAEIGQLKSLQSLELGGNDFTMLPTEIKHLRQLRYLGLSSCKLTTLPSEIDQLEQLEVLWLLNCQLTTLPETITQLHKLRKLNIIGNINLQLTPVQEQFLQGIDAFIR
jgi:genome sequencing data, contig C250